MKPNNLQSAIGNPSLMGGSLCIFRCLLLAKSPCAPRILTAAHSRYPSLQCAKNTSCIFAVKILRRSGRSQRQQKIHSKPPSPPFSEALPQLNGFTFLELALVICVVSILYAVALRYSIRVLAMTERVTVEQTILALQNAVEFQALRHLLSGNMERLVQLEQSNPMDYLVRKPNAYLGELKNVDPKQVKEGAWYFDKTNRLIVYRLRYGRYFESTLKGPPLIRLSIKLQYTDVNRNGRFDEKSERVTGLTLEPKESYAFTVEPSSLAGFLK